MTQIQSLRAMKFRATVIIFITALTLASRYRLGESATVIIRGCTPHEPGK